uniref:Uncharacterized protein n=1 Tax=Chromera velia CCMP2878 TaxID=1169474 RepID=A0A0G4EYZ0_9ALVE|eukprot:Cvel_14184.t1-p1 / transcript=Cvel_14184.t1 / gene=Cvel_14184 / organism=Chromera_velia_CCMP2878 / gene_product=hypothetical protein / transcript_product=hypothetical protein / location=Cvel_scaffold1000:21314-25375(-) / protein_length=1041 / sequence_SO=supercontig / SO=protein_coding / is_pseudo=false
MKKPTDIPALSQNLKHAVKHKKDGLLRRISFEVQELLEKDASLCSSSALWECVQILAAQKEKGKEHPQFWTRVIQTVTSEVSSLPPPTLCAYAKCLLSVSETETETALRRRFFEVASQRVVERPEDFTVNQLSMLCLSLSSSASLIDHALIAAAAAVAAKRRREVSGRDAAVLVHAIAKGASVRETAQVALQSLLPLLKDRLSRLSPQGLAMVLWGLAKSNVRDVGLEETLRKECVRKGDEFEMPHVVQILSALVRVDTPDAFLLSVLARRVETLVMKDLEGHEEENGTGGVVATRHVGVLAHGFVRFFGFLREHGRHGDVGLVLGCLARWLCARGSENLLGKKRKKERMQPEVTSTTLNAFAIFLNEHMDSRSRVRQTLLPVDGVGVSDGTAVVDLGGETERVVGDGAVVQMGEAVGVLLEVLEQSLDSLSPHDLTFSMNALGLLGGGQERLFASVCTRLLEGGGVSKLSDLELRQALNRLKDLKLGGRGVCGNMRAFVLQCAEAVESRARRLGPDAVASALESLSLLDLHIEDREEEEEGVGVRTPVLHGVYRVGFREILQGAALGGDAGLSVSKAVNALHACALVMTLPVVRLGGSPFGGGNTAERFLKREWQLERATAASILLRRVADGRSFSWRGEKERRKVRVALYALWLCVIRDGHLLPVPQNGKAHEGDRKASRVRLPSVPLSLPHLVVFSRAARAVGAGEGEAQSREQEEVESLSGHRQGLSQREVRHVKTRKGGHRGAEREGDERKTDSTQIYAESLAKPFEERENSVEGTEICLARGEIECQGRTTIEAGGTRTEGQGRSPTVSDLSTDAQLSADHLSVVLTLEALQERHGFDDLLPHGIMRGLSSPAFLPDSSMPSSSSSPSDGRIWKLSHEASLGPFSVDVLIANSVFEKERSREGDRRTTLDQLPTANEGDKELAASSSSPCTFVPEAFFERSRETNSQESQESHLFERDQKSDPDLAAEINKCSEKADNRHPEGNVLSNDQQAELDSTCRDFENSEKPVRTKSTQPVSQGVRGDALMNENQTRAFL